MGHDFITYGDRHVHLNDNHILMLRHFFLEQASTRTPADLGVDEATMDLLRSYLDKWEWAGPGVVLGTELSNFVQQKAERRDALLRLFLLTSERLMQFGQAIPLEYLKHHLSDLGFVAPAPIDRLVRALRQLSEMLA